MSSSSAPSPFHRVVVYYQTQYHDKKYVSPTPLIPVATHLIIAAFHLNTGKTITLNNISPEDSSLNPMWVDVAQMQKSGIKVLGMLGGAARGSYKDLVDDFDDYYKLLSDCIKTHKLDGLDLDVEEIEGLVDIEKLIKQLKSDFGKDFIITLAPVASALDGGSNLSGFSYTQLERDIGSDIDWYNVQFYSSFGSMSGTNDYTNIVAKFPLDPSRLVAGTLTNSANGGGWVELDTVKSTMRQLLKLYGDRFGGIAGWEYYNSKPDTSEPWSWAALMKLAMINWKEVLAAE